MTLEKFKVEGKKVPPKPIDPIVPVRPTLRYLCFDQSLANTGWAVIQSGQVIDVGNIRTEPRFKGHEDTLRRAALLYREAWYLMDDTLADVVVHETPPVGAQMMRPEASLMSATAIRCAADRKNLPVVMIGAQKAKKRVTGNGNAPKPAVKAGVAKLLDKKPPRFNQGIVDAIALGLVASEQEVPDVW